MKKHSDEPLAVEPSNVEPLNAAHRAHVRYVGFESIGGERCLRFCVKSIGHDSVEITFKISDAAFTGVAGISIQDAAPMAYEKLVGLLATGDTLDSNNLCLTDADIAQYITRHLSSQKRAYGISGGTRRSDVAA